MQLCHVYRAIILVLTDAFNFLADFGCEERNSIVRILTILETIEASNKIDFSQINLVNASDDFISENNKEFQEKISD